MWHTPHFALVEHIKGLKLQKGGLDLINVERIRGRVTLSPAMGNRAG